MDFIDVLNIYILMDLIFVVMIYSYYLEKWLIKSSIGEAVDNKMQNTDKSYKVSVNISPIDVIKISNQEIAKTIIVVILFLQNSMIGFFVYIALLIRHRIDIKKLPEGENEKENFIFTLRYFPYLCLFTLDVFMIPELLAKVLI